MKFGHFKQYLCVGNMRYTVHTTESMPPSAFGQVSGYSSRSDGCFPEPSSGGSWPGPEILAINLIAENPPFDSTWHIRSLDVTATGS